MKTLLKQKATLVAMMCVGMLSLNSCSNGDDDNQAYVCETCVDTPDALPANDVKASGVYKGIVVGSSGTVRFDIQNGSNTISAVLTIDGTTVNLTAQAMPTDGEPYVSAFTGTLNGSPISVTFQVGAQGGAPTVISSSIPGHPNAVFQVYKETSTSLVEAFEGTYQKPGETGIFNIILSTALGGFKGIAKDDQTQTVNDIGGGYDGATGYITNEDGEQVARIVGDELNGQFQDSDGTVTVTGRRTL